MADYPAKLQFLFTPMRYKVARGGRGSAKSWSFARALLQLGVSKPLRILCTREVQNSIADSVHKLLSDQIQAMGYGAHYDVIKTAIVGRNGTSFMFAGLSDQTVESLKSYEGVDICWCEEAQAISAKSWKILIPTIRKDAPEGPFNLGSEIWVSYNPELETDETHQRFTVNPPEDCISVMVNYHDNPWFPRVLEKERLDCLKRYPADYPNIWEGKCKPAVQGAIYYDEVAKCEEEQRICNLPVDPMLKTHVVMDLGWNDSMSIAFVQRLRSEIRVVDYIEDDHRTLDSYSAEMKDKGYNWGKLYLPHDGKHKDIKTGKSSGEIMEKMGWSVEYTDNISIEDGIRLTRMSFGQFYFAKDKTKRLVECAKRYRRQINQTTQEASTPLHDEFSHGADNLRYIAINADKMKNEAAGRKPDFSQVYRR